MNECAARNVTCNFSRKVGHFERTCRAQKKTRGNSSVGVIQGQANQERFESEETGDEESQHEISVRWVNPTAEKRLRSWDSDSSGGGGGGGGEGIIWCWLCERKIELNCE